MKLLICGSRSYSNGVTIAAVLRRYDPATTTIIAGAAKGADRTAATIARDQGFDVIEVPAQWEKYGRSAGYRRNVQMLDMQPDHVIAFWDGESRGTAHTMREARTRGISVEVVQ